MSRLIRNYLYNIIYQVFILIVPLITAPYLTRVLGATNMGIYSYINSYAAIISTMSLLGIYNYGVRQLAYVRDDKAEFNRTFWEINILRLVLAILGSTCYFILAKQEYKHYLALYFPWLIANYIDLSWLFVAVEDMGPAVLKNFVAKLISVVGIFVLVRERDQVWVYISLLSVSTLVANISLLPQVKKYVSRPQININNMKKHISGTVLLFLPQIANLLYMQIDKIMMEGLTGKLDQISFYDQAEKIVKIPMTFITVMSTVMMPRMANEFSRGNNERIKSYMTSISQLSLALSIPMIVGIASVAWKFIPWYLGSEYTPTATAMIIMAPIILSNALSGISSSQYFVAINKMNIVIWSNIIAAILNVVVNALLIPRYGYIGAAIASVLASYTIVVMQYIRLHRDISVFTLLTSLPRYLVNAIIMGIVIYLVSKNMETSPATTFLQIAVGIIVYMAMLILEKDSLVQMGIAYIKKKMRR